MVKHFVLKCGLFLLFLVVIDKAFLPLRNSVPNRVSDPRVRDLLEGNIDADILIMGSSRGDESIRNTELEEATGKKVFNLSFHGTEVEFSTFLLELFVDRNRLPETIVRVLDDPHELCKEEYIDFRFDLLYPLVKYAPVRKELVKRGQKNWLLNALFVSHQVNWQAFDFRQPPAHNDTLLRYGTQVELNDKSLPKGEYVRDSSLNQSLELREKVQAFKRFEAICHERDVNLVLALAPNYREVTQGFMQRIKELADPETHLFEFDRCLQAYADSTCYNDPTHLNRKGAGLYTSELATCLNKLEKE